MKLSLATHFAQHGQYGEDNFAAILPLLKDSGTTGIRDEISWGAVERSRGTYDFGAWQQTYVDAVSTSGLDVLLTIQPQGNPLYGDGKTILTDTDIEAFAQFVLAVCQTFPQIGGIVIGNEINSYVESFASGEILTYSLPDRAAAYARITARVGEVLEDNGVTVDLIGGGLHSVPTGYIDYLIDADGFAGVDGLDFHPYGLDPVQLTTVLTELDRTLSRLPQDQRPDLYVTEFGQSADPTDPLSNADYLIKMAAVMAHGGVVEASWYSLLDEDWYDYADMGLYDGLDTANPMLSTFQLVTDLLAQGTAQRIDAGPGLFLYRMAPDTWILWGSTQNVTLGGTELAFRDALDRAVTFDGRIDDSVVVITGRDVTVMAQSGPGQLIGDSFYDFSLQANTDDAPFGWTSMGLRTDARGEQFFDLSVMAGQSRNGESWNPYLGDAWARPFFVDGKTVMPVDFGTLARPDERAAVDRYSFETTQNVDVVASFSVSDQTTDGVRVEVRLNNRIIHSEVVMDRSALVLRNVAVKRGDDLDVIVHDNGTSQGDMTERHVRILQADGSTSTQSLLRTHLNTDIIAGNDVTERDLLPVTPSQSQVPVPGPAVPAPVVPGSGAGVLPSGSDKAATGTAGHDRLNGSSRADTIKGEGGNDRLYGGGGNDRLYGGTGDDRVQGGTGRDTLAGDAGNDTLLGESDNDRLYGGSGNDRLYGGAGDDRVQGGTGRDTLAGDAGNDTLLGESDNDRLYGGSGNDRLFGGAGDDRIQGGTGRDMLEGDAGNDTLLGESDNDRLYGGSGNDRLFGGAGDDRIQGGTGRDMLEGDAGNDTLLGESDNDRLYGGSGNDRLFGGAGDDRIQGGTGRD
ncbi:Hemolysin-type calcium-binding repeat-containing protein, partial [Loktanella fryxellensis]